MKRRKPQGIALRPSSEGPTVAPQGAIRESRETSATRESERLTPARAANLIKLLYAGLPMEIAIGRLLPTADKTTVTRLATDWPTTDELHAAHVAYMGGEWQDLSNERRLQLARDKFLAEQAYILFSQSLHTSKAPGQMHAAFDTINTHLTATGKGSRGEMESFIDDFNDGAASDEPPVFTGIGE